MSILKKPKAGDLHTSGHHLIQMIERNLKAESKKIFNVLTLSVIENCLILLLLLRNQNTIFLL